MRSLIYYFYIFNFECFCRVRKIDITIIKGKYNKERKNVEEKKKNPKIHKCSEIEEVKSVQTHCSSVCIGQRNRLKPWDRSITKPKTHRIFNGKANQYFLPIRIITRRRIKLTVMAWQWGLIRATGNRPKQKCLQEIGIVRRGQPERIWGKIEELLRKEIQTQKLGPSRRWAAITGYWRLPWPGGELYRWKPKEGQV